MITSLTLLRGNEALTKRWLNGVNSLTGLFGGDIIRAVCKKGSVKPVGFKKGLSVVYAEQDGCGDVGGDQFEKSCKKADYICKVFEEQIKQINSDKILLFDDDIVPPAGAIEKMLPALNGDTKCVCALYATHSGQAEYMQGEWGLPTDMDKVPKGLFEVWAGGYAFSLWDAEALKSVLPFERIGPVTDWNYSVGLKFAQNNWKTRVHADVICKHG